MSTRDFRLLWLSVRVIDNVLAASPVDHDLSPVQFFTLRFIGLHDRPNLSATAEALNVSNAAATKLVDRLAKKGLVTRALGDTDRRERQLSLTDKGCHLLAAASGLGEERVARILETMAGEDREYLRRGLLAFLAASLRAPADIKQACLRCGRQHESDCPGDELYRKLDGAPRTV